MTERASLDTNMEIRAGLLVDDYDSLGGPETALTRRQAFGAGKGMAAGAGAMVGVGAMAGQASAATPDVWEEPSLSSNERYSLEQEPALQGGV